MDCVWLAFWLRISRESLELITTRNRFKPNWPFCINIVFVFSWDHCKSQEKLETMLMQNFGGQTKSIMVFSEVAY